MKTQHELLFELCFVSTALQNIKENCLVFDLLFVHPLDFISTHFVFFLLSALPTDVSEKEGFSDSGF